MRSKVLQEFNLNQSPLTHISIRIIDDIHISFPKHNFFMSQKCRNMIFTHHILIKKNQTHRIKKGNDQVNT